MPPGNVRALLWPRAPVSESIEQIEEGSEELIDAVEEIEEVSARKENPKKYMSISIF